MTISRGFVLGALDDLGLVCLSCDTIVTHDCGCPDSANSCAAAGEIHSVKRKIVRLSPPAHP